MGREEKLSVNAEITVVPIITAHTQPYRILDGPEVWGPRLWQALHSFEDDWDIEAFSNSEESPLPKLCQEETIISIKISRKIRKTDLAPIKSKKVDWQTHHSKSVLRNSRPGFNEGLAIRRNGYQSRK